MQKTIESIATTDNIVMKITKQQFEKIKHVFPKPRSSVQTDHFTMINILLYVVENGCKW